MEILQKAEHLSVLRVQSNLTLAFTLKKKLLRTNTSKHTTNTMPSMRLQIHWHAESTWLVRMPRYFKQHFAEELKIHDTHVSLLLVVGGATVTPLDVLKVQHLVAPT
jgi:hypothetical protein